MAKRKKKKKVTKRKKQVKKVKKKRDIKRFPGLEKNLFSKVKQEYHDIDYANQLSDKEKAWLSQFMEEYLGANLNEDGHKSKYNRKPLHKSKRHRKDCFDRNNARQRDIYGLSRAMGTLTDGEKIETYLDAMSDTDVSYEDRLIEELDNAHLPKESDDSGESND